LARLVDVVANDETVAVASASLRHDDLTPMTVVHASFHLFGPAVRRLLGVGRIGFGRQAPGTVPVQGVHDVTWVTGACLAARSSVLERLGGFDDGFFLYEEDADLQYRAHELGRVVVVGDAVVVHAQGGSASHSGEEARGARLATAQVRFIAKHQGRVAATMYAVLAVLRYLPNAVAERFTRRPRWYSAKVGALVRQAAVEWR
jgi:GT2 family glycosyltransferase